MPQVNRLLLQEKADAVSRCIQRISSKKPATQDLLLTDIDAQDIITLNLERSVQACVDIAAHIIAYSPLPAAVTMADSFSVLCNCKIISKDLSDRMRKAVGLRNLLVHEYQTINWDIVWSVLTVHLSDPLDFVKTVLDWSAKVPAGS